MVVHLFLNNNKALDFLPINSIKNGGITYIQTYIAGKNDFLNLSDEVKELIKFAAEHGIIEYKIENQEGLIEDKSTAESNPLIIRVQYDPDETDQHYLIQAKALEIVSSIN
ncbi:hypothetical protein [Acinetobacter towneri]|uniref:hypothetical protein n=1 Tax=Acinetobacter towneri TaxID=202956 RepID=UPI0025756763|nr:hypothetical protein [Acinetobacter towneri]MDM1742696.1 hypothetical protein [Acinetobacter towneri]